MKFAITTLLALTALVSAVKPDPTCNKDAALINKEYIGHKYTKEIAGKLHSSNIRVVEEDQSITLEFVPSRLNIHVDDREVIESANCG